MVLDWFREDIIEAFNTFPDSLAVEFLFHITGESEVQLTDAKREISPYCKVNGPPGVTVRYGRPDISNSINDWSKSFGPRTMIVSSGNETFRTTVSSTVAALQKLVMLGKTNQQGVKYEEIYLHTEAFEF